jgi:hypothetical protein
VAIVITSKRVKIAGSEKANLLNRIVKFCHDLYNLLPLAQGTSRTSKHNTISYKRGVMSVM